MTNNFSHLIIRWYQQNKRSLPWRETSDPYAVWLSEVILQQTRVDQGIAYYLAFIERWPDVKSLAQASEQEVLRMWQGLGYYSRARNILFAAQQIVNEYKGMFPSNFEQIKQLKGIGDYTASAIASIAFNKPYSAIDGNVMRVLARYFGIEEAIDTSAGRKILTQLSDELLDKQNPGVYNQAVMEFGAMQCVPVSPQCTVCIFSNSCRAFSLNRVSELPVKQKSIKTRKRFFNYFICTYQLNDKCFVRLNKRVGKDVWKGMFDFPLIETDEEVDFSQLMQHKLFNTIAASDQFVFSKSSGQVKHVLTHQIIFARFYHLQCIETIDLKTNFDVSLVDVKKLNEYPLPRLIDKYLQSLNENFCNIKH